MKDTFGDTAPTTKSEFVIGANRHLYAIKETNQNYRRGQAFFSYFAHWFPETQVPVDVDPFYDPENLPAFNEWVDIFFETQDRKGSMAG